MLHLVFKVNEEGGNIFFPRTTLEMIKKSQTNVREMCKERGKACLIKSHGSLHYCLLMLP